MVRVVQTSSGIATLANAYITKLAQTSGTSGSANEVPVADWIRWLELATGQHNWCG